MGWNLTESTTYEKGGGTVPYPILQQFSFSRRVQLAFYSNYSMKEVVAKKDAESCMLSPLKTTM